MSDIVIEYGMVIADPQNKGIHITIDRYWKEDVDPHSYKVSLKYADGRESSYYTDDLISALDRGEFYFIKKIEDIFNSLPTLEKKNFSDWYDKICEIQGDKEWPESADTFLEENGYLDDGTLYTIFREADGEKFTSLNLYFEDGESEYYLEKHE